MRARGRAAPRAAGAAGPIDAMGRSARVLALLGGTFDPVHYGHLRLAAEVKAALSLPEVRLIPDRQPSASPCAGGLRRDRLAMTALGCKEFAGLVADGHEVEREGPELHRATLEASCTPSSRLCPWRC